MKRRGIWSSMVVFGLWATPSWSQTTCPPNLNVPTPLATPLMNCFSELVQRIVALETRQATVPNGLPVGTIISSYLQLVQFAQAIGESEGSSSDRRTWILADGREVIGTRFAILTQGKPVPDLRGMFLRGIMVDGPRRAAAAQVCAAVKK
jgi:hypothetical protein